VERSHALVGVFLATFALLGALALVVVTPAESQPQTGPTLRVKAGLGQGVISVNQYPGDPAFPEGNTVRVAEGTTVVWTLGSDETHTVTFRVDPSWPPVLMPQAEDASRPPMFNPQLVTPTVPNGPWDGTTFIHMELQSPGQELRVTFGRQGRFRYSCLFHEEMDGYVEVVAPGSPGITTQAAVDEFAATHVAREHAEDAAKIIATRSRPVRLEGQDGANIWFVRAGTNERRGHLDINAFLPDSLMVSQGDTVVWYVDHVQPHTVTFPSAQGERPELVSVQLPDGRMLPAPMPGQEPPPDLVAAFADPANAPRVVMTGGVPSRPSPVHDGRSMYNSGLIGEHPLITYPMEKTWALTFGTAGVYQYDCALHQAQGMKGTITVVAR
jgi:plastocyanin